MYSTFYDFESGVQGFTADAWGGTTPTVTSNSTWSASRPKFINDSGDLPLLDSFGGTEDSQPNGWGKTFTGGNGDSMLTNYHGGITTSPADRLISGYGAAVLKNGGYSNDWAYSVKILEVNAIEMYLEVKDNDSNVAWNNGWGIGIYNDNTFDMYEVVSSVTNMIKTSTSLPIPAAVGQEFANARVGNDIHLYQRASSQSDWIFCGSGTLSSPDSAVYFISPAVEFNIAGTVIDDIKGGSGTFTGGRKSVSLAVTAMPAESSAVARGPYIPVGRGERVRVRAIQKRVVGDWNTYANLWVSGFDGGLNYISAGNGIVGGGGDQDLAPITSAWYTVPANVTLVQPFLALETWGVGGGNGERLFDAVVVERELSNLSPISNRMGVLL